MLFIQTTRGESLAMQKLPLRFVLVLALIAAIVVSNTFADGRHLQIDARAAGVGAAVIAAWRKAPLIAVMARV